MSWSLSVPPTPRENFDASVDDAEPTGQDSSLPGVADDVEAAKAALKDLAKRIKRPIITAAAGGHCLQADEGPNWSDSISVNMYGADA